MIAALALGLGCSACNTATPTHDANRRDGAPLYRFQLQSPVYTIDKLYSSMQGPSTVEALRLGGESEIEELVWLTGYRAEVTDATGNEPLSAEFMCHSAMDTRDDRYRETFPTAMSLRGNRVFSVDQGTLENTLPEGFGIPMLSSHDMLVATQVLNHNVVADPFEVRQRVTVEFVRDVDLQQPLKPLIQHGIYGLTLVEGPDGYLGVTPGSAVEDRHGPGCSLAEDVGHPGGLVLDRHGRRFSSFWVVPPGRHSYHTRVTDALALPYDTDIHYAAAHLHPFATSLELFDLTAKQSVIKLKATASDEGLGLADVESYTSVNGRTLYADHEYDLIAEYDNTSGTDQDAMATMLLYVLVRDLEFRKPDGDPTKQSTWARITTSALLPR
jgi:hypothetical protein